MRSSCCWTNSRAWAFTRSSSWSQSTKNQSTESKTRKREEQNQRVGATMAEETEEKAAVIEEPSEEVALPKEEPGRLDMPEPSVHRKVAAIQFAVLSPQQIKKMAVVKVVTPELYDREGYPVDGGLMDTRMGVIDPGLVCRTDGKKLKDCPGYFGYIELARPVIHVKFANLILTLLKSTCRECGRILVLQNKINALNAELERVEKEEGPEARRRMLKELIGGMKTATKCPHCKAKQQKVTLDKPTTYLEAEKRLNPIEIRVRLEKITDDDLILFGMNPKFIRPEWMILTVMAIPPVTMRPSITLESGERSEDALTHKLGDIVRINQRLFENINAGAPEIIIEDLWDLLQYHITTFFDNEVPQIPPARHRSGQPLKTLTERIKSKEGRFRHNLAGKRVNFAARTVISPDPKIEFNEVGVPYVIAEDLTIGYVVERHLMNGDVCVFNRQPSLHRMSIMCHKIKVMPGRSFRLNPAVCTPYNADFDGDEMNLHVPHNE